MKRGMSEKGIEEPPSPGDRSKSGGSAPPVFPMDPTAYRVWVATNCGSDGRTAVLAICERR